MRLYVCPTCHRTGSTNYGKTTRLKRSGVYQTYRKCKHCECKFSVQLSRDVNETSGFVFPTPSQQIVITAKPSYTRTGSEYLIAIDLAWNQGEIAADLVISGHPATAERLSKSGVFLAGTGQRLICLKEDESVLNDGLWLSQDTLEIPGYWPEMISHPLRHGGSSETAAFCWAAMSGNPILLHGFTYPDNEWRDIFDTILRKKPPPITFDGGSGLLQELWLKCGGE